MRRRRTESIAIDNAIWAEADDISDSYRGIDLLQGGGVLLTHGLAQIHATQEQLFTPAVHFGINLLSDFSNRILNDA